MDTRELTEHIMIDMPLPPPNYASGSDESILVRVDRRTRLAFDRDARGGEYAGVLCNDSERYPGLTAGTPVIFEMRGERRPVACFRGFLSEIEKAEPEDRAGLARQIAGRRDYPLDGPAKEISERRPCMSYKNPVPALWDDEKSTKVTVTLTFESDVPVTREEAARDLNKMLRLDCIRPEHVKLGEMRKRSR